MTQPTISPVLIVGAGPTGMTTALELAHYGIPSIILDEDHKLSEGSRAIAFHQSALAVWEKLGVAQEMLQLGISWWVRHTYRGMRRLYEQDFGKPAKGYLPHYINLSQYDVERLLSERISKEPLIEICWDHKVIGLCQNADAVTLTVETTDGNVEITGKYVLACDGARSTMRKLLNLDFPGRTFNDYFLIADIKAELNFPAQPRFFFDHPTNPGNTILIHPQPNDIWRIDWQIGSDLDPEIECSPEKMDRRIRALIGDTPYKIVWLSTYRFHQRLLAQFKHGRVLFAGDSAHLVAPFGARGMNSAIQDLENLSWKLVFVLNGLASPALLDTYQAERWPAQAENQRVTLKTMRFMAPNTPWLKLRRNAILGLSEHFLPARKWVDSGKMSIPFVYKETPLNYPDLPGENWSAAPALGAKLPDLPIKVYRTGKVQKDFLRHLLGCGFVALLFVEKEDQAKDFLAQMTKSKNRLPLKVYPVCRNNSGSLEAILDPEETLSKGLAAKAGSLYLIRPDGHITMRRRAGQASDLITYLEMITRLK